MKIEKKHPPKSFRWIVFYIPRLNNIIRHNYRKDRVSNVILLTEQPTADSPGICTVWTRAGEKF
jgi:hypothetical protein